MASTETRLNFDAEATTMLHALLAEVYEEGFKVGSEAEKQGWGQHGFSDDRVANPYREDLQSAPKPVDHHWTPGKFSGTCRVMLARYPCPYPQADHPEGPPESITLHGYREDPS